MLQKIYSLSRSKLFLWLIFFLVFLCGIYIFLVQRARNHAAEIFNDFMSRQKVLAGSVTAKEISADISGNVYFTDLQWKSFTGETLLSVPDVRIKVKPWDIVLQRVGISTIEEVELSKARIYLTFDEKMRIDVLQKNKQDREKHYALDKRNLRISQALPDIKLILHDTVLAANYRQREFILNDVDGYVQIKNHKQMRMHISAGKYGGSIAGEGLNIDGIVELEGEQKLNLALGLYEVIPDSLGLHKVYDPMTVTGQVTGVLQSPLIDGTVYLKELHLPNLYFTMINGNFHYEDALISFDDVTGSIYGGELKAFGLYHFDNHQYKIDIKAEKLRASLAAKSTKIKTKVDLEIKFRNLGRRENNLVYGNFQSGSGSFMLIPFQSISGNFNDQNGELVFSDVEVKTKLGTFESDAFKFVKGRLQLGDIFIVDNNGNRKQIR